MGKQRKGETIQQNQDKSIRLELTMEGILSHAKEGLLALAVQSGLQVFQAMMGKRDPTGWIQRKAQSKVAREADVLVVLTLLVSHSVMWRLKEYSADRGKEIRFVWETGTRRILERV